MIRTHLRHHENILKWMPIHADGLNLSLVMRKLEGIDKPRRLLEGFALIFALIGVVWAWFSTRRAASHTTEMKLGLRAEWPAAA